MPTEYSKLAESKEVLILRDNHLQAKRILLEELSRSSCNTIIKNSKEHNIRIKQKISNDPICTKIFSTLLEKAGSEQDNEIWHNAQIGLHISLGWVPFVGTIDKPLMLASKRLAEIRLENSLTISETFEVMDIIFLEWNKILKNIAEKNKELEAEVQNLEQKVDQYKEKEIREREKYEQIRRENLQLESPREVDLAKKNEYLEKKVLKLEELATSAESVIQGGKIELESAYRKINTLENAKKEIIEYRNKFDLEWKDYKNKILDLELENSILRREERKIKDDPFKPIKDCSSNVASLIVLLTICIALMSLGYTFHYLVTLFKKDHAKKR